MKAELLREVIACDYGQATLWEHGWQDKRKFKGRALSTLPRLESVDDPDPRQVVRATVHHGWVITVAGDTSGCGWDMTTYFRDDEPVVVDGRWDGASVYDEDGEEVEGGAEVVDGPHRATWLDIE